MGQDIYTEVWKKILRKVAKKQTSGEALHDTFSAIDITALGDRTTTKYDGKMTAFLGFVNYNKDSAPFRDLRIAFESSIEFRNSFPGLLEVKITVDDELSISHRFVTVHDLIAFYRREQVPNNLQQERYKFERIKKFQEKWKQYEAKRISFIDLLSGQPFGNLITGEFAAANFIHMLKHAPLEFESALLYLYDEEVSIAERIQNYPKMFEVAFNDTPDRGSQVGQEERTIGTLLCFRYPEKYTLYKDSFYTPICRGMGITPKKPGQKLLHYYDEIIPLIVDSVRRDTSLVAWEQSSLVEDCYKDPNQLLLSQDILYKTIETLKKMNNTTFTTIIDKLREVMQEDPVLQTLQITTIEDKGLNKESFAWIKDSQFLIGNLDAHYEIILRSKNGKRLFFVDAHFENEIIENRKPFYQEIGKMLPDGFEWIDWHKTKSIGSVTGINLEDEAIVDKLATQLRNLEQELGDKIRKVVQSSKASDTSEIAMKCSLNTILYGPPGTGKTFKLNEYKEKYFTDRGVTKSSEEVLKEKVAAYPFWKVLGAVLGTSAKPLTVSEIIEHPIVKARINPANKTKPNNLAWTDLQSYADDESTKLEGKYRRSIKLFHKGNESKWAIADDKKEDLANIIDQELLDVAKNPVFLPVQSTAFKTRFNFITFHQKYSYEDFIEGIKPLLQDDDVEEAVVDLQFELKKGVFYNSCLEALKLVGYNSFTECHDDTIENRTTKFEAVKTIPSKQFALFIDEINRANISAVFGELITLLEEDKRMGAAYEMWVELPYSNEMFCVPANLYVIGTMNTADRSIALLDIALRRRFEFEALYPIYTETAWWSPILETLNQAIYNWKKNPDFFIGHAFFINRSEADRINIFNTKIIPLLYEYCQNNAETIKRILSEAGVKIKTTSIKENFQIIAE